MNRITAPELEQFVVADVQQTQVNLGNGAYGSVEEVEIPGARVAAKKLHTQLIILGSPQQVHKWVTDFVEECKLMSQLHHPHIVHFLGVAYLPGSQLPVLLMEKLQTSLDNLLETSPNIPLDVKVYLLTGTARGVVYLHSHTPPIAHRDLTARNILIDSGLTAKITDLGVARMVNIQPGQLAATMTQGPGTNLYMPPEAVQDEGATQYNTSIDIFSFGVVSLFTLTQTFPKDLKPHNFFDPVTRRLIARSEIERREDYIQQMKTALSETHPLVKLTLNCLEYLPGDRPSAVEALRRLKEFGGIIPCTCTKTKLELIRQIAQNSEVIARKEEEIQLVQRQLSERNIQISSLQKASDQKQAQMDNLQAEKQTQANEYEELTARQQQQLEVQRKEIEQLSNQLKSLELQSQLEVFQGSREEGDMFAASSKKIADKKPSTEEVNEKFLCKFRLFCRHPVTCDLYEKKLEVHQDVPFIAVIKQAYELLGLNGLVPLNQCRLVKYDEYTKTLDQSFEETKDVTFGELVGGARSYYAFELFMEIREEGEVFQVYRRGGLNVKVMIISLPSQQVDRPLFIRAELGWTVHRLKETIARKFSLPLDTMVIALETYQNEGRPLNDSTMTLKNEGFYRQQTVYVCCDAEDCQIEFRESKMNEAIDRHANILDIHIDRQSTLEELKKKLEEHVKLPSSKFKVYRLYSNNQLYEMIRLHDSLSTVPSETRLVVRPGQALVPGEFRVRLFLLNINDVQFMTPILESLVHKGMSIREFKEQIITEAYKQRVDLPLTVDRLRLRKKTWKIPGTVYLDHQIIERDIHVFANFEMYVEPLEGPEPKLESTMIQVYVRHWHPSAYTVDPTREIVLSDTSPAHLKLKISKLSGIPVENVDFAKAYGSFPCEQSVLDIEKDLDWNPQVTSVTSMPLSIYDDGSIIYFKDSTEKLAHLSPRRRDELQKS